MPIPLDQVLCCRSLPTLPAVAVEVLALTRDPNVPLERIASTIQNDPALTAKVLRTVNSSYYGLAQKCATLNRAIGFLGVKTVKSLVLGFCLVDSTRDVESAGFDLTAYWRRGISSATAARIIASATGSTDPDEAFTACLFQDIGMLACYAAMGDEYDALLASAPLSHEGLSAHERALLGFDHCECGAMFAEKWNLPAQHVETIRHHHAPDQSPEAFADLARVVSLGNLVAEVAESEIAAPAAAALVTRVNEWFGNHGLNVEDLLERTGSAARQLAKEFGKDPGPKFDAAAIMAEANELLLESRLEVEREAVTLKRSAEELSRIASTDALTGAFNRKHLEQVLPRLFDDSRPDPARNPLSVLFIDGDRFKDVNDTHGHAAGDAVLKELVRRFRDAAPQGSTVFRNGGEEFIVVVPGHARIGGVEVAERIRHEVSRSAFSLAGTGARVDALPVTVSIGVASLDDRSTYPDAWALVRAADDAVYAAKSKGRNRVEHAGDLGPSEPVVAVTSVASCSPTTPVSSHAPVCHPIDPAMTTKNANATRSIEGDTEPARSGTIDVLLVEDDPLAGRLLTTLLGRRPNTAVRLVRSAEEAMPLLNGSAETLPNLVITDFRLRVMTGAQLIACARANPKTREIPIIVLSASSDPQDEAECVRAGATFYMHKDSIVTDLNRTLARMLSAAA